MPFTRYILSALLCCVLGVISGLSSAPVLVGPRTTYQIQVHQELGHRLSSEAEIYFSHDPEFSNYTARWNKGTAPDIAVVVVPASKEDVTKIIKFANAINAPFYVSNRGHGTPISQLAVENGILINMRKFSCIEIAEDGNSALMGGGVYIDQVIRTLDAAGKATSTGICGCVGGMGPALGGGFGFYMGYFGLATDQILELDVVLADGSNIKVSATSHPDLYWGMRGAGHNFGIVTQYKYKIYPRPSPEWYYSMQTFTGDKLEEFFRLLNKLGDNGNQPKEWMIYTVYAMNPAISTTEPVILLTAYHAGPPSSALPDLQPFLDLGPTTVVNSTVAYPDLAGATGLGIQSPICQEGNSGVFNPVGLKTWNITTNRAVYGFFKKMVNEEPGFNNSVVQFENYSVQKMQSIDPESTAYPHRDDNLLGSFLMYYRPSPRLHALVDKYGKPGRAIFDTGEPDRPLTAYVNYARGDEKVQQKYGYEPWRLHRLRALKKKYDPENRFRYYNPIV